MIKKIQIEGGKEIDVSVEKNGEIKINNKTTGIQVNKNNTYTTCYSQRDRDDLKNLSLEAVALKLIVFMK